MNVSPQRDIQAGPAALAGRHVPVLHFDKAEPFFPAALGFTIHDEDGPAASADHTVRLGEAECAIEYSIWWDWDIQHLYELEHVWIYLDRNEAVVRVEASAHGFINEVRTRGGGLPLENGWVALFSEPGKHGFAASPEDLRANFAFTNRVCGPGAGADTVLVLKQFEEALRELTVYDHHLARKYLQSCQFAPTYRFDTRFDLRTIPLMPWAELQAGIPLRMKVELERLRSQETGVKAVFLDSGDTLIDESSQVFVEGELVLQADPIPGGDRLVSELKKRGYLVALVADGLVESFENVHGALGFWDQFDAKAISEELGVEKPDRLMFDTAVRALGLRETDHAGCVMVGNNLARDIAGANRLGMRSVWLNWTKRYPTVPANEDEVPDFTIKLPHQLLGVLEDIDQMNLG